MHWTSRLVLLCLLLLYSVQPSQECCRSSRNMRVHLVNGGTPNQGRVELEIGDRRGTICDDSFDNRDATVICRMAGYDAGGEAMPSAHYGEGPSSMPILLDDVNCGGTEDSVLDCEHQPLGTHNCAHSEDVGVVCTVPGEDVSSTTTSTTRGPPVSVFDDIQCGLRPMEKLLQARELAPRELAPPHAPKIVGGYLALHGMYPWQVRIQKINNGEMEARHWCGGTILSNRWVLSAAHCFRNLHKSNVVIRVGDHGQKERDRGEQRFLVEELIMHGSYNRYGYDYDIALLKVKSTDGQGITFNNYVQPACLPACLDVYVPGTECLISGWGATEDDHGSKFLRAARVRLRGFDECQSLHQERLTERMLCAGYLEGGIDTCQGDSGGPLVCKVNGSYTVLGITSWGWGCALPLRPGVYAKTVQFLRWIEDTIRHHSGTV